MMSKEKLRVIEGEYMWKELREEEQEWREKAG